MDNRAGNFRRDTLYIRTRSDLDNSHDVYFLMTQLARSSFVYTHTHTHTFVYIANIQFRERSPIRFFLSVLGAIMLRARRQIKETGTSISCMHYLSTDSNGEPKSTIEKPFRRKICPFDVCYSPLKSFAHREHGQYFTGLSHNRYFTIINCLSPRAITIGIHLNSANVSSISTVRKKLRETIAITSGINTTEESYPRVQFFPFDDFFSFFLFSFLFFFLSLFFRSSPVQVETIR